MKSKIFYKYKSCVGESNDRNSNFYHLIDSLRNKYLYLTRPENLNDKDECKLFNNYNASNDDIRKWLENHPCLVEVIKKKFPKKDLVCVVRKYIQKSVKFRRQMDICVQEEREHFHIFSLTENPKNDKMWNIYAECFSVVCFGYEAKNILTENDCFDFSDKDFRYFIEISDDISGVDGFWLKQNNKYYLGVVNVKYAKRTPLKCKVFRLYDEEEKQKIRDSFLVKNNTATNGMTDWSYEQESRIILLDYHFPREEKIDLMIHYPDHVLKEVWFGHNIDCQKKQMVKNCIIDNYTNNFDIKFKTF